MRRSSLLPLLFALILASAEARADTAPPRPPLIPGGVADASGQLGFFTNAEGGIDAVDLSSGARRWTSREGQVPLYSDLRLLAVAAPDPARQRKALVRFLNVSDGKVAPQTPSAPLPDAVVLLPPRMAPDRMTPMVALSAWVPKDGRWRIRWESRWSPTYGMRLAGPGESKHSAGVLLVDPSTRSVETAADEAPPATAPALPSGFPPDRSLVYFNWSDHGSGWTSTPRAFWIGPGLAGAFAHEPQGERHLSLLRWRSGEVLPPLPLHSGAEYYPMVAMDGRFVVLSVQRPGQPEEYLMIDLLRPGGVSPQKLPPLETGFRLPLAVLGPLLLYVAEKPVENGSPGLTVERRLIAQKHAGGERAWTYPLAPRLEAPPVPGGGFPR